MHMTFAYWRHQVVIGLFWVAMLSLLGHLDYGRWVLVTGFTMADGYFILSWLAFPFAKWAVLVDGRQVQAPTIRRRRKAVAPSGLNEQMLRPKRVQAAAKTPLKWYWRGVVDLGLVFLGPLVLGGYLTYSLRHN
ncbi:hypothetical protein FD13_GL000516 [Levilactobacillus senmaizukei DSM 21775 = NBRC 103853]|uniref:Uncharacterized protein n=1 Tax=Levilactobacillus senmaizukei DSM 21775 = NBRC 103853 TaxID=1423803 RepID=A0A0R2DD48_9LACO|nr:hypothetical protein [Levilactobacillus senmaizukei]KRN01809.1 hypothetical protein FD13_GL000516 [Levilactobacillus senmaizukei DSM 21775 = NBRC 103853]